MPYGIQRLNVKRSQPNANIVFIKPLSGPDEKIAQDFLERIAAQCRKFCSSCTKNPKGESADEFAVPVMRENTLSVMSLEEFPPNREFVGRNFNAGEVIQLVLKSPSTGRWLPFEYVQMVMMHELAHCKQMNHSKAFWAVRNQYVTQMYGLWRKGYTGDGIWGRGANLRTGEWERNTVLADEVLPEHLCGGTYRSRGRKRKAKPALSYKEQKERRILKKFGANGVSLGADEEAKVKLEKGKKVQAKPRVAGSARGRELRAAAALARFAPKKEEPDVKDEDETVWGSDSDDNDSKDAVDLDGSHMVDDKGHHMVRVCGDEQVDDSEAQDESKELLNVLRGKIKTEPVDLTEEADDEVAEDGARPTRRPNGSPRLYDIPPAPISLGSDRRRPSPSRNVTQRDASHTLETRSKPLAHSAAEGEIHVAQCPICTFSNATSAPRCEMCFHVLNLAADPAAWTCTSDMCEVKKYANAGDCGLCGLCGKKKPS